MSEQRRFGAVVPGDGVGRRRGVCGGNERGDRGAPYGGLGWVGGGREVGRRREDEPILGLDWGEGDRG